MNEVNFDDFKCRCSAITKMMANSRDNPVLTEKQAIRLAELEKKDKLTDNQAAEMADLLVKRSNSTKIILSDTCIEYLMEWYSWKVSGKIPVDKEAMDIEYTKKGKSEEGESIALLSRVDRAVYIKNEERVENEYLSGIPDIYQGDTLMTATKIIDNKAIWDYPGFLKNIHKKPENGYIDQIGGYCDITGASEGEIAKTLVNMPEEIILDYQFRLLKKMNCATTESPEFKEEWAKWERSMRFDDIPKEQRVFKIPVQPFTQERKQAIYDRVKVCREWLWKFHEQYLQFNK